MERESVLSLSQPANETAWLAGRLLKRQVVDVSGVEPVGRVVDLVFDPKSRQVMGLVVASADGWSTPFAPLTRLLKRRRGVAPVGLDHIIAMDGDVITLNANPFRLPASSRVREMERMPRLSDICEMTILTMRGMSLGALADLLLEDQGTTVAGYVVNPTMAGERALPPLDSLFPLVDSKPASAANPRVRVIPASSDVRVGDSLILLVSEVKPLREEVIVIPLEAAARAKLKGEKPVIIPW